MKTLPHVDTVVIGGGWSGLLMAKELGTRSSHSVVVLERGPSRHSSDYADQMDELDFSVRLRMMQDASRETVTLRHDLKQRALPLRQFGSFLPGSGVGGAGEHWSGVFPRYLPDLFELRSRTIEKYGAARLPEDHAIEDWGLRYDELEPHYAQVDLLLGISGKAGNLRGQKVEGGNVFEGWRSAEYPTPPTKIPYFSALFGEAAKKLGYHPYPSPAATPSQAYSNPDGVSRAACTYCGYCEHFGCMVGAKAQPSNVLLPVIERRKSVSIRTGASVRRILHAADGNGRKARGVTYVDSRGAELFQPADLVFLGSWTLNNTRLLLLSGIGDPYDPATNQGTLGRNLTHQIHVEAATLYFDKPLNRFMGSGAAAMSVSDFDGDVFDRGDLPFLRGGTLHARNPGARPIANFGVVPPSVKSSWGSEWKKAAIEYYDRVASINFTGEHIAYRGNCLDLDPTYKDHLGDPLLRLTLDWRDNDRRMSEFGIGKAVELGQAMGAKEVVGSEALGHYDAVRYQSTHLQGGTIMGASPERSVVNPYGQHWQVPNLFVLGASCFPQNASANPTPTVLAVTYRTADAVINRYLKKPAALA